MMINKNVNKNEFWEWNTSKHRRISTSLLGKEGGLEVRNNWFIVSSRDNAPKSNYYDNVRYVTLRYRIIVVVVCCLLSVVITAVVWCGVKRKETNTRGYQHFHQYTNYYIIIMSYLYHTHTHTHTHNSTHTARTIDRVQTKFLYNKRSNKVDSIFVL